MPQIATQLATESEADVQGQATKRVLVDLSNGGDALARFKPERGTDPSSGGEALAKFKPENEEPDAPTPAPASTRNRLSITQTIIGVSAIVAVGIALATIFLLKNRVAVSDAAKPVPLTGRALLNSRPSGAVVLVDGVVRGVTPLELELPAGQHDVVLRSAGSERTVALTIENGARLVENVEMPTAASTTAEIDVTSDPSAARVTLDGRFVGQTPLKVHDISAGRHEIVIAHGSTTTHNTVDVTPGTTASVFVSLAAARGTGATGTFAVDSPVELRLLEGGQLLGLSNAQPLNLSAGKHQIELVNDALELRQTRTVTVEADRTTRVTVPAPNGTLFVNASPWAEVFVDGKSIGVTPLGNVSVSAGTHELLFRHPQFGERGRSITVGVRTPVRVAMDMRK